MSFPRGPPLRRGRAYRHWLSFQRDLASSTDSSTDATDTSTDTSETSTDTSTEPNTDMDKKDAHDDEVYKRCNPDLAAWAGFGLTNNLEALPPDLQPQIIGTHYGEGQRKALEAIFIHQEGAITKPQFEIPDCWLDRRGLDPRSTATDQKNKRRGGERGCPSARKS